MKNRNRLVQLALTFAVASAAVAFQAAKNPDAARWEQQARSINIIRDDWGIAHVYGKTDADAVFGMEYAQAEDDFNRVETNYLNSLGRLAEAEGPSAIFQDLRQKLFVDPDSLRAQYRKSPLCLRRGDLGPVLRLSGVQRHRRMDAYIERRGQHR